MTNRLKRSLREKTYPVGNWVSIGHPIVTEVNAVLGFDFVLIDTEHTPTTLESVVEMVRAIEAQTDAMEPVVRVPDHDPTQIKRVLDLGVHSIMIPKIESASDARAVVEAVRYPPDGVRGIAGGRAATYGLDFVDYVRRANESIVTIAQIETRGGVERAGEIAAVDGIDALFVGPSDLSGALGAFAQWDAAELTDAIERVLRAGRASDTPIGTLTVDPEQIEQRVQQGFDFLIVGKDTAELASASIAAKERYEDAVERYGNEVSTTRE